MPIVRETSTGSNFLSKIKTDAESSIKSSIQRYEKYVGSDGATSNTVYTLAGTYVKGSNTLLVFVNGQKAELNASGTTATEYEETTVQTVTFKDSLLDADVVEFIIVGSYFVNNADITSHVNDTFTDLNKNKIINGGFPIWQRDTTQTAAGYSSDDRWNNSHNGSTKTHNQQAFALGQTDVPRNPKYFSRTVVTSVGGAGNQCRKYQRIENVETLSGQTATLSFYAKVDVAKDIAVEFQQNFGTGGSPSSGLDGSDGLPVQTFPLTTSWQKFTVTVDIPSISGKTLGTDNNDFLVLNMWFDAGSDYDARTNSLGQQSGTFDIAQVQLEEGSVATDFEDRHIGDELALCQRYYIDMDFQQTCSINTAESTAISSVRARLSTTWPVTMRTTPTVTAINFNGYNSSGSETVIFTSSDKHMFVAETNTNGTVRILNAGSTANVKADAEL